MSVQIYQFPHSPYCLPITRALEALGVAFDVVNVSNADRSEIIRLTNGAYYQVPVLVHDGQIVFDGSEVAAEVTRRTTTGETPPPHVGGYDGLDVPRYVDRIWAQGRLFPAALAGLQAILIPHIEGEVEGATFKLADIHYLPTLTDLVERTMVVRHKERRFGRGCVDQWRANYEPMYAHATELLRPFDAMVAGQPFLLGPQPVYADFALYGVLANLTYNDWNPFPPLPRLAEWFARMKAFRFA
jgi:glutathione S-transferase